MGPEEVAEPEMGDAHGWPVDAPEGFGGHDPILPEIAAYLSPADFACGG
jgi:hypothetical protein